MSNTYLESAFVIGETAFGQDKPAGLVIDWTEPFPIHWSLNHQRLLDDLLLVRVHRTAAIVGERQTTEIHIQQQSQVSIRFSLQITVAGSDK